tara:strand:- start:78 stop:320 length:243 start_codon:yes stop_codon:yes gene_type:complete
MAVKKKAAPSKKKAPAKPKAVEMPANPTRVYGATVFSVVTDDKAKAADLVGSHGFKFFREDASGFHLYADALAYASYRGE